MKKYISNPRKGFSIMEVVVALVIITLVSAVVTTIIKSSTTIERNTMSVMKATTITENIIECFRYADSKEEFDPLLEKFVEMYEVNYDELNNRARYVIREGSYRITFTINYVSGESGYVADELEINTIVNGKNIYDCIYTKE